MNKFILYGMASVLVCGSQLSAHTPRDIPGTYWNLQYERFCLDRHEYIHFTNSYSGKADMIVHDPDCYYCVEAVTLADILEEIKKHCPTAATDNDMDIFSQEIKKSILTVQTKDKKDKPKKDKHKD